MQDPAASGQRPSPGPGRDGKRLGGMGRREDARDKLGAHRREPDLRGAARHDDGPSRTFRIHEASAPRDAGIGPPGHHRAPRERRRASGHPAVHRLGVGAGRDIGLVGGLVDLLDLGGDLDQDTRGRDEKGEQVFPGPCRPRPLPGACPTGFLRPIPRTELSIAAMTKATRVTDGQAARTSAITW